MTAPIWDSLYLAPALAQRAMLRAADAAFAAASDRHALYAAAVEVLERWAGVHPIRRSASAARSFERGAGRRQISIALQPPGAPDWG